MDCGQKRPNHAGNRKLYQQAPSPARPGHATEAGGSFIAEVLNKHREAERKRQDNYRSTREASGDIGKGGDVGKGRKGDIRAAQSPWNHSELRGVFPNDGENCMGAQQGL